MHHGISSAPNLVKRLSSNMAVQLPIICSNGWLLTQLSCSTDHKTTAFTYRPKSTHHHSRSSAPLHVYNSCIWWGWWLIQDLKSTVGFYEHQKKITVKCGTGVLCIMWHWRRGECRQKQSYLPIQVSWSSIRCGISRESSCITEGLKWLIPKKLQQSTTESWAQTRLLRYNIKTESPSFTETLNMIHRHLYQFQHYQVLKNWLLWMSCYQYFVCIGVSQAITGCNSTWINCKWLTEINNLRDTADEHKYSISFIATSQQVVAEEEKTSTF